MTIHPTLLRCLASLWMLTAPFPALAGDSDNGSEAGNPYGAPPVVGAAAAASRPKLTRKPAVKDFQADPALVKALDAALKRQSAAIQLAEWEAGAAIESAEKSPPNEVSVAQVQAALQCDKAYQASLNNTWRVRAAEHYRKSAVPANYDIARSLLLTVLRSPTIGPDDVSSVALELRELAITDGYTLNITVEDLKGFAPGVAKIFSTHDKKTVDLNTLGLLFNAGELFRENGDRIWAAQMYRTCLNMRPRRGPTAASDKLLQASASKALQSMGLNVLPGYQATKNVQKRYVTDAAAAKPSANFLEENKPVVNVWAGISNEVTSIVFNKPGLVKYINEADITRFTNALVPMLGSDFKNYRPLFLQSICQMVMQQYYPGNYPAAITYCRQETFKDLTPQPISMEDLPDTDSEKDLIWVDYFKNKLGVEYLKTDNDRAPYKLTIDKGLLMREGKVFDTSGSSTAFSGKGWAIYVVSPDGEIFAGTHKVSIFHHSSFLSAADVAGAGELKVEKGILTAISNKSGHYYPGCAQLAQSLDAFEFMKASLAEVKELQVFGVVNSASGPVTGKKLWPYPVLKFRDSWKSDQAGFAATFKSLNFVNDPLAP